MKEKHQQQWAWLQNLYAQSVTDNLCDTIAMDCCGHLFCMSCTRTTEKCYTCRTQLEGALGLLTIDPLTLKMVKMGNFDITVLGPV